MSIPAGDHSPALRVVWPIEALGTIATEAGYRTALVLVVDRAGDFDRRLLKSGLAERLARSGVELFALVGVGAEHAHDALDWVLEEAGADHVLTSWHGEHDPEDVASFVVATSRGNSLTRIVAAVDVGTELGATLRDRIAETIEAYADE
ncbi:MAG: hypothetical protein U0974_03970 [Gemmatimonadales bacterium]|nr:hypothetical protein [Gemmatimonadales bacterium]MDZ4388871.1 hypothetical protein [Gemmatimonadales bacterium]